MKLKLKELPLLGYVNPPYKQRRMTDEEMKRKDIDPGKLYMVRYDGIWLLGRFTMTWYGWVFDPNLGSLSPQVNDLEAIFEVEGLEQKVHGSTAMFIAGYLKEERECEESLEDEED